MNRGTEVPPLPPPRSFRDRNPAAYRAAPGCGTPRSPRRPGQFPCSVRCKTAARDFQAHTARARRSAGRAPASQVAEGQLEADIPVRGLGARFFAVLREEADVEDVFVGA